MLLYLLMSSQSSREFVEMPDHAGVREPMAPALMRSAHGEAMSRLLAEVRAAGFTEVRAAHLPLLQFPGPHNCSPVQIGRRTGRSKQHINLLLGDLENAGYLERRPDPKRPRGSTVLLTPRGLDLVATMKSGLEAIEADWTRKLGKRRFDALRRALEDLQETERTRL